MINVIVISAHITLSAGRQVTIISNGEDAYRIIKRHSYDMKDKQGNLMWYRGNPNDGIPSFGGTRIERTVKTQQILQPNMSITIPYSVSARICLTILARNGETILNPSLIAGVDTIILQGNRCSIYGIHGETIIE